MSRKKIKGVGLISGGLDSMLAAKHLQKLGIDVYGVHFALPWGCGSQMRAETAARQIGIPIKVIRADDDFLSLLKNPKFGYGSAINPCVDCHIHMIKKAAAYMNEIHADFVFTGEVLGQRPMSQLKNSLRAVEKSCGIDGRLLRPLCAKLLNPTILETEGAIPREQLLSIHGRGRKEQRRLAHEYGITDFPNSGGGCLLTDKNFGYRLRDLFAHGCTELKETHILKWGRHFRVSESHKVIVARDEHECDELAAHAQSSDLIFELPDHRGPIAVLQGKNPSEKIIEVAGGLVLFFSRYRGQSGRIVTYWKSMTSGSRLNIHAPILSENDVKFYKIENPQTPS